jgi:lysophospholipase L1-like esterase
MSVQVTYKKQGLFYLILLLCMFTVVESGSRFYEFFIQDCKLESAETLREYDYFLKRHICYDQQILAYIQHPVLTIIPNQHFTTINVNNEGFRGDEINISKTNNDYRIIIIGGSTVFGSGLSNDKQTIPYELNKIFDKKYTNVEVINAGISSITSFEELYHFKEKLIHLKPDLMIFYDGHNDVEYRKTSDPEILNIENELKIKDFQKYLRSPVVIYRYVLLPIIDSQTENVMDINNSINTTNSNSYNFQLSNSITSLWHKHITEFCEIAKNEQIKSIVIIQPSLNQNKKPLSEYEKNIYVKDNHTKKTFDMLIQKSDSLTNCSKVYDFTNVFENTFSGVYVDSVHLNNYGNKIIAEKIYEKILPIVIKDIKK